MPKATKRKLPPTNSEVWSEAAQKAAEALDDLIELQDKFSDLYEEFSETQQNSTIGLRVQAILEINLEEAKDLITDALNSDIPDDDDLPGEDQPPTT